MSYFLVANSSIADSSIADCQLPIANFVIAERHINSLQRQTIVEDLKLAIGNRQLAVEESAIGNWKCY